MKKTFLTLSIIGISFGAFGQWNSTGNNSTTGTVIASEFEMTSGDGKTGFYIQRPNSSDDPFKITMGYQTIKGGIMIGREDWNSKVIIPWDVGIGTTNPNGWKLAVNGKIRAKEIKVETGWSDFVFFDNYKLPTLQEVENHIKENGHLKDIPSAKEVEENGVFLGEMDSKLLQKIEELTLYTIQQEKQLNEQSKEIKKLKILVQKLLESKK